MAYTGVPPRQNRVINTEVTIRHHGEQGDAVSPEIEFGFSMIEKHSSCSAQFINHRHCVKRNGIYVLKEASSSSYFRQLCIV